MMSLVFLLNILVNKEYLLDVNLILNNAKIIHKIDKNEVR